jgi:hypothetical protein
MSGQVSIDDVRSESAMLKQAPNKRGAVRHSPDLTTDLMKAIIGALDTHTAKR